MSIDFKKLVNGNTVDSILSPREIFRALPNKLPPFDYLRENWGQIFAFCILHSTS